MICAGSIPNSSTWAASVTCADSNGVPYFVVSGGAGSQSSISMFNLITNKWEEIQIQNDTFFPRWGHSAAVFPSIESENVYLFGGWNSTSQFNDIQVFDCEKKSITKIKTEGDPPSHRSAHSVTVFGSRMFVFGGAYCDNGPYKFFNDTVMFDAENKTWKTVKCSGDIPSPRSQHSATQFGTKMIIIGGYDGNVFLNDIYQLELMTAVWSKLKTKGDKIPTLNMTSPNFRVAPARHTACLFGKDLLLHGIWGTFVLNLESLQLTKLSLENTPLRNAHVVFGNGNNRMILFGGTSMSEEKMDPHSIWEFLV